MLVPPSPSLVRPGMRWLGRYGRILLGTATAGLAVLVVVGTVGSYRQHGRWSDTGPAYPRIQEAAGIIDLLRAADPGLRPAVIRALDGVNLRARIVEAAPDESADLRRAVRDEERLREFAAPGLDAGLRVYMRAADPVRSFDTEGWPARVVWPMGDGHFLVLAFIEHMRPASGLAPLPAWFLIGVAGVAVAALTLLLVRRESRSLRRVAAAAETFQGTPRSIDDADGAPEIRRLAVAVQEMQQRVATLLQERSFLIGAISHDLRTCMTKALLRAETIADERQRERMTADLEAMSDLIDTSLAFARGTTLSQHRNVVDLADLMAVEAAERAALGRPVALVGEEGGDALIPGDPIGLRRVLANLVDNALKFGRGRVEVRLDEEGSFYLMTVDDDGPGVGAAERVAIFAPFYRIERSRNRRTGGSGLGLAIARQIVEAHGGTITVGASPLGGARFTARLPRTAAE